MGSALAVGTGVALSCLAIPLTAGIIGLSGFAALGANLGIIAILASALIVAWTIRTRWRGETEVSGNSDG